jgi:hypothetical protein
LIITYSCPLLAFHFFSMAKRRAVSLGLAFFLNVFFSLRLPLFSVVILEITLGSAAAPTIGSDFIQRHCEGPNVAGTPLMWETAETRDFLMLYVCLHSSSTYRDTRFSGFIEFLKAARRLILDIFLKESCDDQKWFGS